MSTKDYTPVAVTSPFGGGSRTFKFGDGEGIGNQFWCGTYFLVPQRDVAEMQKGAGKIRGLVTQLRELGDLFAAGSPLRQAYIGAAAMVERTFDTPVSRDVKAEPTAPLSFDRVDPNHPTVTLPLREYEELVHADMLRDLARNWEITAHLHPLGSEAGQAMQGAYSTAAKQLRSLIDTKRDKVKPKDEAAEVRAFYNSDTSVRGLDAMRYGMSVLDSPAWKAQQALRNEEFRKRLKALEEIIFPAAKTKDDPFRTIKPTPLPTLNALLAEYQQREYRRLSEELERVSPKPETENDSRTEDRETVQPSNSHPSGWSVDGLPAVPHHRVEDFIRREGERIRDHGL